MTWKDDIRATVINVGKFKSDVGFKYVDYELEHTLAVMRQYGAFLQPDAGHRLFEFGPGPGYFLHLMRNIFQVHDVSGCDIGTRPLYKEIQNRLGLAGLVVDEGVRPGKRLKCLRGEYDILCGMGISWMREWGQAELDFFLEDCFDHLTTNGRIFLYINHFTLDMKCFSKYKVERYKECGVLLGHQV
jgi:hypothetical protein